MRICLVTTEFPPAIGGMGQAAHRIASALATCTPHEIHVLWFDNEWGIKEPRGPFHRRSVDAFALHYVELAPWQYENPSLAFYHQLNRLCDSVAFDTIVAFGVSYCGFPVLLAARERGIPAVVSLHGSDLQRDVFRPERFGHIHWSLAKADKIVSVNHSALRMAQAICDLNGRGTVIPNHIAPEDFEQGTTATLPLPPDTLVLVMAAGFAYNKGLHLLLETACKFRERRFSVLLIGDAHIEHIEDFQNQIAAYAGRLPIITTGVVPHRSMLSYLRCGDIFVLPSLSEGAPNVLLEAMLARLPIVASAVGGIPQTIEHEVSGLLVEPGSVEELASALTRLADDPQLRCRLAESAYQTACTRFSPQREAAAWDALFRSGRRRLDRHDMFSPVDWAMVRPR